MSNNKLKKYLKRKLPDISGNKHCTPIIISDSKGNYLHDFVQTEIELELRWYCVKGRTAEQGYIWLQQNIDQLITRLQSIHIYIWLGTCDLTKYFHPFVSLSSCDDSKLQSVISVFHKYAELVKSKPECHITFLEIPTYSIYEWNKYRNHPNPAQFKKEDDQLITQVNKLNELIRDLNTEINTSQPSPVFSHDIFHNQEKTSKSKTYTIRQSYNFTLYKDGIHPSENLAKVWLKKIALTVQKDCWE